MAEGPVLTNTDTNMNMKIKTNVLLMQGNLVSYLYQYMCKILTNLDTDYWFR